MILDPAAQVKRKRAGGFRGQVFSEGYGINFHVDDQLIAASDSFYLFLSFLLFTLTWMHYYVVLIVSAIIIV